jgi:hypothetical protein
MGAVRNAYKIFYRKLERKRPLGRPRYRWEDNIRMDLRQGEEVWTGFIWFSTGTSGGIL